MKEVFLLIVVQLYMYKFTKTHLIVQLKWMTFMACKLYLSETTNKWVATQNFKFFLRGPFKKWDSIADFIVLYFFGILSETYLINFYVKCSLDSNCGTEIIICLSQNLVTNSSFFSLTREHWFRMIGFMFNNY